MKPEGHEFKCGICRETFVIPFDDYFGQFDHPPSEPICDECDYDGNPDDLDSPEAQRRGI
jgi:hypothetical protein